MPKIGQIKLLTTGIILTISTQNKTQHKIEIWAKIRPHEKDQSTKSSKAPQLLEKKRNKTETQKYHYLFVNVCTRVNITTSCRHRAAVFLEPTKEKRKIKPNEHLLQVNLLQKKQDKK